MRRGSPSIWPEPKPASNDSDLDEKWCQRPFDVAEPTLEFKSRAVLGPDLVLWLRCVTWCLQHRFLQKSALCEAEAGRISCGAPSDFGLSFPSKHDSCACMYIGGADIFTCARW